MNRAPEPHSQTISGLGCVAGALAPVALMAVLDIVGVLHIENGLLIALWLVLTLPAALMVLGVGIWADRRSRR